MKENIVKIKTVEPEKYLSSIDSSRKSIDRFIRYKRRVCNGEFSSLVLENGETVKGEKERLTEEEKIIWKHENTKISWKVENLNLIVGRMSGWQLETFKESYEHKTKF